MAERPEYLYPKLKEQLAQICGIDEADRIDRTLAEDQKHFRRYDRASTAATFAGFILAYFGLSCIILYHHRSSVKNVPVAFLNGELYHYSAPLIAVGLFFVLVGIFWGYELRRVDAPYLVLSALLTGILTVDPAKKTPLASRKRRNLARWLLRGAKRINYFGPFVAYKLDHMIIRQQSDRAAQVLRHCVYPALLGSDVELDALQTVLAKAALKVVISDWVSIGELAIELEQYKVLPMTKRERWSHQIGPISLAVLTAIPAVPAVIALLK